MLINGPINVVRLEGTFNNVNKIIYVFFDYHSSLGLQTECESYDSENIVKYLYNLFKTSKKQIDFFLEIKESLIKKEVPPFKNIYISEIAKMYNKLKFNNETKKNIQNNIRFHYMDIRDHLERYIYNNTDILNNSARNLRNNMDIFSYDFNNIVMSCAQLIYELEIYMNYFKNTDMTKNKENKENKEAEDKIIYFLDKITKKYINKDIINKLKKEYFNDVVEKINECIEKLKKLHKIVLDKEDYVYRYYDEKTKLNNTTDFNNSFNTYNNYEELDKFVFNCNKLIEEIQKLILYIFLKLTDIFFIRRFLDKDYIMNAITYTGSAHSINYINILVSYFNFKITHFSYSEEKNLEKLNMIAKNDVSKLNYILHPQHLIQCSDISSFPNDFI